MGARYGIPFPARHRLDVAPAPIANRIPRVYVAGPFRGPDAFAIAENVRRAERVALDLWRAGCSAYCPHSNTANFQGAAPDEVWLAGHIEWLKQCDAVVLVENWWLSRGTLAEIRVAFDRGIPIFESGRELLGFYGVGAGGPVAEFSDSECFARWLKAFKA